MPGLVYACIAEGLEEVECLAAADVLIRGGVRVKLVSMTKEKIITGAHGIKLVADELWEDAVIAEADCILLPGGMPGTKNLSAHAGLARALTDHLKGGKRVAAICAAPSILGELGLLAGKTATCYPGFEQSLKGAVFTKNEVVTDGLITTAKSLGYALDFGLELLSLLAGREMADKVKNEIK